jgi:RimJ/RimL family protein N-acetyltransferase
VPETDRMVLRRASWPDVDDVVALTTDAEVMGFDDTPPLTPARVLAEEMPRLMAHQQRTDQLGFWVARERATGAFLGWFMMTPVMTRDGAKGDAGGDAANGSRAVRLGYRLRRRAWDQDYGTEGMLQLIEMARAAEMSTVIASTPSGNRAAGRVMQQAGLQPDPAGGRGAGGPVSDTEHWQLDVAAVPYHAATA